MMFSRQATASTSVAPLFVGREALLQSLRTTLSTEHMVVLTGEHGSGKTALAREYARRFAGEYQQIVWLNATTPEALLADVLSLSLRFPSSVEKDRVAWQGVAGISKLIEEWLGQREDTLIVLDNALLLADTPPPQEQRPLRGHLLLIRRSRRDERSQPAVPCLATESCDAREGTLFVLRQAGLLAQHVPLEQVGTEQYQQAQELTRELSGMPLTLTLAGGYLNATGCGVPAYLFAYRDYPARLKSSPEREIQTLEIVCDLTLASLAQSQPIALRLLQMCALLSPCAIPYALFQQRNLQQILFPEEESEQYAELLCKAVQTLFNYRLLDKQSHAGALSLHPLLQSVIRQTLPRKQQDDLSEQLLVACLHLALASEKGRSNDLPALSFWLAGHIRSLFTESEVVDFWSEEAADALVWAASLLGEQGLIEEAEQLLRKAVDIWKQTVGSASPRVASALLYLAIFNAQLHMSHP